MKKNAPSLDALFSVMSAASFGDASARARVPEDPSADDAPTRLAIALNVLLDDLAARATAAQRMAERLQIVAAAAHEFSAATQDLERLLEAVARRLALVMKDQCVVLLASEDSRTLIAAATHGADESVERQTRRTFSEPLALREHPIARRVQEGGEAFAAPKVDLEQLRTHTTPSFLEHWRRIGLHSFLIVPLCAHGRPLGQLVLTRYRADSPPFDEADKALACSLAEHAAMAIANARSSAAERAARAAAESAKDALRASEERYRLMFDNSPLPKWMYDSETLRILAVNDAAVREYRYSREEFLEMTIGDVCAPEDALGFLPTEQESDRPELGVRSHRRKNGEIFQVEVTMHTFLHGGRSCRLAVAKDLTERLRLEEQVRQSQKMDAAGRLAAGVAHDFNNALSVVLGYSEMLLGDMKADEPRRGDVQQILKAGRRAAELTRQLLMFSRRQVLEPEVTDLNELVMTMDKILRHVLGADVAFVSRPGESLGRVHADRGSVEQILMNLVVNAREAMPRGGTLTLETDNVTLDEAFAELHPGVKAGPHVVLAVTDTGAGMDRATIARIFEPLFTTKARGGGGGTGLGLSSVLGTVQQSGGGVSVSSEPARGTTFSIYLPRVDADVEVAAASEAVGASRGFETILVVEHDEQVRAVASSILRRSGYHLMEAASAGEALLCAEKYSGPIHLLLTEVVMAQMNGPELAKRLVSSRPDMRALCMSGQADDRVVRSGVLEPRLPSIQKPLTPEALTARVREVLGAAAGSKRRPRRASVGPRARTDRP